LLLAIPGMTWTVIRLSADGGIMTKITIAACAFIMGICCGLLLNNNVPTVSASSPDQQTGAPQKPRRGTISSSGFGNSGEGVHIEGAIPVFRDLESTPIFTDVQIFNTKQSLDGLECHNCEFDNAKLRYSGGAFNLENVKFSGTTSVELGGAAANTIAFLEFLNSLSVGIPVASPTANKPIEKRAETKKPLPKISFTAPFIGPKGD